MGLQVHRCSANCDAVAYSQKLNYIDRKLIEYGFQINRRRHLHSQRSFAASCSKLPDLQIAKAQNKHLQLNNGSENGQLPVLPTARFSSLIKMCYTPDELFDCVSTYVRTQNLQPSEVSDLFKALVRIESKFPRDSGYTATAWRAEIARLYSHAYQQPNASSTQQPLSSSCVDNGSKQHPMTQLLERYALPQLLFSLRGMDMYQLCFCCQSLRELHVPPPTARFFINRMSHHMHRQLSKYYTPNLADAAELDSVTDVLSSSSVCSLLQGLCHYYATFRPHKDVIRTLQNCYLSGIGRASPSEKARVFYGLSHYIDRIDIAPNVASAALCVLKDTCADPIRGELSANDVARIAKGFISNVKLQVFVKEVGRQLELYVIGAARNGMSVSEENLATIAYVWAQIGDVGAAARRAFDRLFIARCHLANVIHFAAILRSYAAFGTQYTSPSFRLHVQQRMVTLMHKQNITPQHLVAMLLFLTKCAARRREGNTWTAHNNTCATAGRLIQHNIKEMTQQRDQLVHCISCLSYLGDEWARGVDVQCVYDGVTDNYQGSLAVKQFEQFVVVVYKTLHICPVDVMMGRWLLRRFARHVKSGKMQESMAARVGKLISYCLVPGQSQNSMTDDIAVQIRSVVQVCQQVYGVEATADGAGTSMQRTVERFKRLIGEGVDSDSGGAEGGDQIDGAADD